MLILINILKFVTVIINYCAALHVIKTNPVVEDPHLVLLNIMDNISASNWTIHTCKRSKLGCLLAGLFCSLLINSPLGINSQWFSTKESIIANDISCIKKESTSNSLPAFNYSTLKQMYLELKHCSFFRIQPELISLIWQIVLTKKWPSHEEVQILKQRSLGKLISKSGQRFLEYLTHVVHSKGTKESWPFTLSMSNVV
jgi:hypothetical protein